MSSIFGGTIRSMSPELIAPDRFGINDSRPTKKSDCYALGMVNYEVRENATVSPFPVALLPYVRSFVGWFLFQT